MEFLRNFSEQKGKILLTKDRKKSIIDLTKHISCVVKYISNNSRGLRRKKGACGVEELYGVFHSYICNPEEYYGYGVLRVRVGDGKYAVCEPRSCVVPLGLTLGTPLKMIGDFREGRQYYYPCDGEPNFIFTDIEQTMPRDLVSAVTFVENMGIRGIARANARHIIEVTGIDIESYFKQNPDPEDFKKRIPSLQMSSSEAFIRRIMTSTTQKKLFDRFQKYGLSYSGVFKLYQIIMKSVGRECSIEEALDILRPHLLNAEGEITNGCYYYCAKSEVIWDVADQMAKDLGYRAYHPERLKSLVYEAMQRINNNGHIWSGLDDVYEACKYIIKRSAFKDEPISKWAIYSAIKMSPWWYKEEGHGERIYLESSWFDERHVVNHVRRIQASNRVLPYYNTIIEDIEKERHIQFSTAQKKCFDFLRESGIKIVTGGAGTGKTTTISGLLTAFTRMNPDLTVALCAPTGRAAQRMTELCKEYGANVRAYTIHKLLDFKPFNGDTAPQYDENNPLSADMIIVDEMSMVDLHLFALLTKAVKDGALVILCGDANQLPSVGAGRVFWDMIESGKFEVVRLTINYRQGGGGSDIIKNAIKINKGDISLANSADFEIISCSNDSDMRDKVMSLISHNPNQTVLTTIRGHNAGVHALNKALQPIVNTSHGQSVAFGDMIFRENDQIIMTHNNYDTGYVNGDVGIITSIDANSITVRLGNEDKVISRKDFKDISLAYAMTIHKSQGSEYDSVIVALPPSAPHMMARNLLYTAVTRGKKHVTLLAKDGDIERAVNNISNSVRRTTLKELLCN